MKKVAKITAIVIAVIFVGMQFVRIDRSNPPVVVENSIGSAVEVPADIQQIMARSCNDCHSNRTVYPWYTNIAPVSWWLRNHIDDGRRHFNADEFATYNLKKQSKKLEEVCDQVRSGEMPLPSYLIIHTDSALSESDKDALCKWSESERTRLQQTNTSEAINQDPNSR